MNSILEIDSVKIIHKSINCLICDKFIETKITTENKNSYIICTDCQKNLNFCKSI